jgi:rhomboid protease GluP
MNHCARCGRELPSFSVGKNDPLCRECRSTAAFAQPGTVPVPQARPKIRRTVTTVLVGINAAVFVGMIATGVSLNRPTPHQLLLWGADFAPLTLQGQLWRMLTSNYVHIGLLHIALNMWCLWNLGALAEMVFDPWTYVLAYTASGLAGSLASLWLHPLAVGAGASGAIFGLAGTMIAALYLGKLPIPRSAIQGTLKSLLMFAGYNLFFGAVVPGIDNSAHIGGLIAGLLIGAGLASSLHVSPDARQARKRMVFIASAVVLYAGTLYVTRQYRARAPQLPPITTPDQ